MDCRRGRDRWAFVEIEPRRLATDFGKLAMNAQYIAADADERDLRLGQPLDRRVTSRSRDAKRISARRHHGRHQRRHGDQGIVDLRFSGRHCLLEPRCIQIDRLSHNFYFPETRCVPVR